MIKAVVFDAYGTLYDVHSVIQKCEECYPGKSREISLIWRQKQLEYSWLRTAIGRYEDFWRLTEDGLRYALDELGLPFDEAIIARILQQYLHLTVYPETFEALSLFRPKKLLILSNGSPAMLDMLGKNTGLSAHLDGALSVDSLKMYKPRPEVYKMAADYLGLEKQDILFASSNGWDVAGAKTFGYVCGWVNRLKKPVERLGTTPDFIVSDLKELALATQSV